MSLKPMNLELFKEKIDDFEASDEWQYKGDKPAVMEFYSPVCPHCRRMAPVIQDLANRYEGQVDFYMVDIQQEEELAEMFDIDGTPTFIFIPLQGELFEVSGEESEAFMIEQINKLL